MKKPDESILALREKDGQLRNEREKEMNYKYKEFNYLHF